MKLHRNAPEKPVKSNFSPPPPPPRSSGAGLGDQSSHFVPPGDTIDELERKAAECGEKAAKAEGPRAAELQREAELYRQWAAALGSGRWSS